MPGIILIGMGLLLGYIMGIFKRIPNQKIVKGSIVSVEYKRDAADRRKTYCAIVEYTVENRTHSVKTGWNSALFHVGQVMTVAYDADNPKRAIVRPRPTDYVEVFALVAAGIVIAWLRFTGQI